MNHLLVPSPRLLQERDGTFSGTLCVTDPRFTACGFFPQTGTREVRFTEDGSLGDGYRLDVTPDGAAIAAAGENAFQYGLATLCQLVRQYGEQIPCMHIEDAPANWHRGVQVCFGQLSVSYRKDWMFDFLREMALLKATHVYLYFEMDYPFACLPYYKREGRVTREELKELIDRAKDYRITIVPCINVLGHCSDFLSYQIHSNLKEYDPETQNPRYSESSALCIQSPKVRSLIEKMVDEVCELFDSEIIHVGGDEVELIGKCPHCKPEFEKYGKNGIYLRYFTFVNSLLEKHGRKMGIWADEVLIMEPECRFWNYRKEQCDASKREQDLALLDRLRDNTIFYDWYYCGESRLTQQFFHDNRLQFIACSSTHGCYMSCMTPGQPYAERSLYVTAEELGAAGMVTTDWINQLCSHAELQYFNFAAGLALNWCGCGDSFCKNATLAEFQQAFSFQKYGIADASLCDYLRYAGDFESELLQFFPPTLRGVALRDMVFDCDNPLTFSMVYSPYLAGERFQKYCACVEKLKSLYEKIDLSRQNEFFFINRLAVVLHRFLSKRYAAMEKVLDKYDAAAKAQPVDKKAFADALTEAAALVRAHKEDANEAIDFAKQCSDAFGLERSPLRRLQRQMKNLDRLADFLLSLRDGHRLLPAFHRIAKFLFSHPQNSYWEPGVTDWLDEPEEFCSYHVDENPAPAAPRGFASEIKYVDY